MALNLRLYVIQKNYKCDNPDCPPIHAFIGHEWNKACVETRIWPRKLSTIMKTK